MEKVKKLCNRIFIEGLSGMAQGLFATLLVGTILEQIGGLIGGTIGGYLIVIATVAKKLTGAGIGMGVAARFRQGALVSVSAAAAGMIGAYAKEITAGELLADGVFTLTGVGEPLGAFVAAYLAVELGGLVAGKTRVDILVTPITTLCVGAAAGLSVGVPISAFMTRIGELINWGAVQQPFWAGIIVSVLMGIALTLPISSAAIGISLNLSGIAAGAAAVGCASNMIGFAVASFRENGIGGLAAQGLGTSMLQMPNIIRRPVIWLPAIVTSAILGPISTCHAEQRHGLRHGNLRPGGSDHGVSDHDAERVFRSFRPDSDSFHAYSAARTACVCDFRIHAQIWLDPARGHEAGHLSGIRASAQAAKNGLHPAIPICVLYIFA